MDTIIITPTQNKLRSIALLTGVVIAIICGLVFLTKTNASESTEASIHTVSESNSFPTLNAITKAASLGPSIMVITKD
jgi:hypothetical protein